MGAVPASRPPFLDVRFEIRSRIRRFDLVAPGFAAVDEGPVDTSDLTLAPTGPVAPYAAVVLRGVATDGPLAAGLASPSGDALLARWSSGRLTLEVRRDGRTWVLARRTHPERPENLAFALCENQATVLVAGTADWVPVLTKRRRVARRVDLRREDVLAHYRYAWQGTASRVEAGLFGMAGLRDPHLVQHADGRPYERDGRLFLTWTAAGLGFFQQAHWTVWSLDPRDPTAPEGMRLEAHLFSRRDGLVLGDHAGQLVRDGDRWLLLVSAWGDFMPGSIHVRHTTSDSDLLSGVHVLDTDPSSLPTEAGSWDPALTRVGGQWHLGFVESPSQRPFAFHPALAATDAVSWTDGLRMVAAESARTTCEGTLLITHGNQTWLAASDRDEQSYPVFDLAGRSVGHLDAPYPTNIPHPNLVPDPRGGWWLLTFDGTPLREDLEYGSHGDLLVMHSADEPA